VAALQTLKGLVGSEVDEAVRRLEQRLQQVAERRQLTLLIPHYPSEKHEAYWVEQERVWTVVASEDTGPGSPGYKYWCSYGATDPGAVPAQLCVLQINVQSTGDPWKTSGALATDGRHTYLLHNGRLSGRMEFARRYPGQRTTVAWPGRSAPLPYFVVGQLEHRHFAKQLGAYVHAVARFKDGGTLAEEYRGTFEQGVDEAIQDLQARIGGADQAGNHQATAELEEAKQRLQRLQSLQEWLRYDTYLLQRPVDKITKEVQDDRRRRTVLSVIAAAMSIVVGWLLSAMSPAAVISAVLHR
jgi:hypothetical protein